MICPMCGYGYRPLVKDGELEGYEQFARPLLRDTPEDRERLVDKVHDLLKEWGDADVRAVNSEEFTDAILSALRGEIGVEPPPEKPE